MFIDIIIIIGRCQSQETMHSEFNATGVRCIIIIIMIIWCMTEHMTKLPTNTILNSNIIKKIYF